MELGNQAWDETEQDRKEEVQAQMRAFKGLSRWKMNTMLLSKSEREVEESL